MTEPEILKTLERLESEDFCEDVKVELPVPAASGVDYSLILDDLRSALGDVEDEPETSFDESQNILEIATAARTLSTEKDEEPFSEAYEIDFSEADTLSNLEDEFPDEILFDADSVNSATDDESRDRSPETSSTDDFENDYFVSESNDFEIIAANQTENIEPVEESFVDEQPVFDSSIGAQTPNDAFDRVPEESAFDFAAPSAFCEPDEYLTDEQPPVSDFDFASASAETSVEYEFESGSEKSEFEEIADDNEYELHSASSETVAEPLEFAAGNDDFSDFLSDETRAFLKELDNEPPALQASLPNVSCEMAIEPALNNEVAETNEPRNPFVVFKLGAQTFAFPASSVSEIGHEPPITPLPFVPSWFSGITNLRGDVIAVLDLRGLWEMTEAEQPKARRKMLVLHSEKENLSVGLLVDTVNQIRHLAESEIAATEEFSNQPFAFCTSGASRTDDSVLPILDAEQLLASPKLRQL